MKFVIILSSEKCGAGWKILSPSCALLRQSIVLAATQKENQAAHGKNGQAPGNLNYVRDHDAVLSCCRIVVVAEQQHGIDRRANPAFGCVLKSQPQLARGIL